jgi:hypothetical protein
LVVATKESSRVLATSEGKGKPVRHLLGSTRPQGLVLSAAGGVGPGARELPVDLIVPCGVVKVVDGHRARLPIAAKSPRVWAYANGRGATNQVVDQVGVG